MAKLNELKQTYPEFSPENFSYDLTSAVKWYRLTSGTNHVFALGNFDIQQRTAVVTFPKTGKWYEFFSRDSVEFATTSQSIQLKPGEYKLYSTRKFDDPHVVTENKTEVSENNEIRIYPNPAQNEINILAVENITEIRVYSVTGKQVLIQKPVSENSIRLNIERFTSGIYLLKIFQNKQVSTLKFVKE
jgi:hypothetical protein